MDGNPGAARDRFSRATVRKLQYGVAVAVLVAGVALSAVLWVALRDQEHDRIRREFEQRSQDHITALVKTLQLDFLEMRSVESFFASSDEVERGEFNTFVTRLMRDHPSIRALQWAPRVPNAKRADYERAAARDGYPDFRITEYDRQGKLVPVSRRGEYYPIFFVEPVNANVAALGFDLATNPACLEAMNLSRDTDQPTLTSRIVLPNEPGDQVGMRVFVPIFGKKVAVNTIADRRQNLEGFAVGVLRMKGVAKESLSSLAPAGIDIHLLDSTDPQHEQPLYFHGSRLRPRRPSGEGGRLAATSASSLHSDPRSGGATLDDHLHGIAAVHRCKNDLASLGRGGRRTAADRPFRGLSHRHRQPERQNGVARSHNWRSQSTTGDRKYKTLYDSSSDAIMLATAEEGFLSGNPAAIALYRLQG